MMKRTYHFLKMTKVLLIFTSLGFCLNTVSGQENKGSLLFEADFEKLGNLEQFMMTDGGAWRIGEDNGSKTLELFQQSQYLPKVRSPRNIAIIKDRKFGSFTLTARARQTGREYGHRDMCIFFNMKDASNFYYVHMASVADPHAHNIFLVNDEPRIAIAEKTTEGVDWQQNWHDIKIERNVETGSIKIYFDDMENPIMEANDKHFDAGYIGFGSFDDTGMIDNIRIYGDSEVKESGEFFKSYKEEQNSKK